MFLYSNVMAHKQTINEALLSFFLDATEAIGDEEMGGNRARIEQGEKKESCTNLLRIQYDGVKE